MVVPTSTIRAPALPITSGMRNEPPISTCCPRLTTTSFPSATVLSMRSTAAALLFTTTTPSVGVRALKRSATRSKRSPRLPVDRSSSRLA